jgi:molecular chaperone GrpE
MSTERPDGMNVGTNVGTNDGTNDETRKAAIQEALDDVAASEAAEGHQTPPRNHADDLIAQLRRDLADYKDRNLRLMADMENLRRRTEDEKASAQRYAIGKFATDVVGLTDIFQRATAAVPAGAAEADPALKSLLEGVAMTEREFLNVLERHGVKRISALGEIFSPHFHQPMMQIPNNDVPNGTILNVLQDGYMLGDRVLRASIVTVSQASPKPSAPPAPSAAVDAAESTNENANNNGGDNSGSRNNA